MTAASRSNRLNLLLWALGPVFGLPVVAFAASGLPEVAADASFGSPGTQVAAMAALVVALLGVGIAWEPRRVSVAVRRAVAATLWIAAGVVAALALGFFVGGTWAVFGLLLAYSALAIGMIGSLVLRRSAGSQPAGLGR